MNQLDLKKRIDENTEYNVLDLDLLGEGAFAFVFRDPHDPSVYIKITNINILKLIIITISQAEITG